MTSIIYEARVISDQLQAFPSGREVAVENIKPRVS